VEDVTIRALVETYANQDTTLQQVLLHRASERDTFIGTHTENYVFLLRTVADGRATRSTFEGRLVVDEELEVKDRDFFISYHRADATWAEWVAWQLEQAGYSTVIQSWDFRPGSNFVLDMQRAARQSKSTIALLSQSYLDSIYTQQEWAAAFAQDPTGEKGNLLPIRIEECELKGLLSQIVYIDLVGLTEERAKDALLSGVSHSRGRAKPTTAPVFPKEANRTVKEGPIFPEVKS